jgi:hypothetical protein
VSLPYFYEGFVARRKREGGREKGLLQEERDGDLWRGCMYGEIFWL